MLRQGAEELGHELQQQNRGKMALMLWREWGIWW
jgi:hypothetical protein